MSVLLTNDRSIRVIIIRIVSAIIFVLLAVVDYKIFQMSWSKNVTTYEDRWLIRILEVSGIATFIFGVIAAGLVKIKSGKFPSSEFETQQENKNPSSGQSGIHLFTSLETQ